MDLKGVFDYCSDMKARLGFVITPVLCALSVCMAAHAGEITLEIRAGSTVREGNIAVFAELTNRGNESADNVWVQAELLGQRIESDREQILLPGRSFETSLGLGEPPVPRGVYTIVIRAHYEDSNGHPFCALSYIPLITAMPGQPDDVICGDIESVSIRQDQEVILRIEPEDSLTTDISVDLQLAIPEEIGSDVSSWNVEIGPGSPKTVEFGIFNKSAIAGSVYSFFIIADYELDGLHRSLPVHGQIKILPSSPWPELLRAGSMCVIVLLLAVLVFVNLRKKPVRVISVPCVDGIVLGLIFIFTLYHLQPGYLFLDTLTVGGDTAAHCYLASHLKEQLFGHGSIVSWAGGWWCGFPMFQYYFCLPYLAMVLLDLVLPFNIAFKLVSVAGILLLPLAVYSSMRMMRAPSAVPALSAMAMVPFLFVRSHTMWGVSIYSTLAGMISNSISFALMVIFMASAFRDSDDGQFRIRTSLLLAAVIASHFFTFIIAALVVLIFPLLRPAAGFRRSFSVLAREALLGVGLMAWWLIPLAAKAAYSVDFGINWDVPIAESVESFPYFSILAFPSFSLFLIPFVAVGLWRGFARGDKVVAVHLVMLAIASFLFLFGFDRIGHVFVNVRLWPFMLYAFLVLAAFGAGDAIRYLKWPVLALTLFLLSGFVFGVGRPNEVRAWAKWNYEGLENKRAHSVIEKLVMPLDGTPGRLANDLSDDNDRGLGSSRVFESVPHLIDKPILEGGLVNSAAGSLFSYYVQGETSESCAGFPTLVEPTTFNWASAEKHLELFNVKHFIARWDETKKALAGSPDWQFIARESDWELYEFTKHDGSYVVIPQNRPAAVRVDDWQKAGLDWIYNIGLVDRPFVLLRNDEDPPDGVDIVDRLDVYDPRPVGPEQYTVEVKECSDRRIRFRTDGIGMPHLVKYTWYPNWKVKGADKVYMVTPCFMLVYPEEAEVELYYGSLFVDNAGRFMSLMALIVLGICLYRKRSDKD